MRITRTLLGLAVAATAIAGTAGPAAAASSCDFTMTSVKARNLDKDNGRQTDFVWLQVEQRWFPSGGDGVEFELNDTRSAASFGNPTAGFGASGLEVRLVLDKSPLNVTVDRIVIACDEVTNAKAIFDDGDAIYDMVYSVTD
jgi:hypothetical protein